MPAAASILLLLVLAPLFQAAPAAADSTLTLDRVTVTGRAHTHANAIIDAEQAAVELVARRTLAVRSYLEHYVLTEAERQEVIDLLMPHSKNYLNTFEVLDHRTDDAGIIEITAMARVEVDTLVITLRNLNLAD